MPLPRRALLSVYDKTEIERIAIALHHVGFELVSTGGTYRALKTAGLEVTEVSKVTGFAEILDGRVKTLHPNIHGGILADRDNPDHMNAIENQNIKPFDVVIVNLYPFEQTINDDASFETCIENIDIGGPAMIRAAAKNLAHVAVIVDPSDYGEIICEIEEKGGELSATTRKRLAKKAFARTAAYDASIASWLHGKENNDLPEFFHLTGVMKQPLRYGENPHQRAAFYRQLAPVDRHENRPGMGTVRQLSGKQLSYNNYNDTNAAFELVSDLDPSRPSVAIIKHANPSGAATADSLIEAYKLALRCDPISAFGGIVACNMPICAQAAEEMVKIFTEVIIAPDADEEAINIITAKKNLRLLLTDGMPSNLHPAFTVTHLASGFLVQQEDRIKMRVQDVKVVTKRAPSDQEMVDMLFAWNVAKHVKSNAIVYAKDGATVGIGAGQMNRLDSSILAARKAFEAAKNANEDETLTKNSVVASDAFFPFADGLLAAAKAGATAIIQPGGSVRDEEVIAAADENGLAMVFTNLRHFRH